MRYHVALGERLLSLSITLSRFMHVVACINTSFFSCPTNIPLYGCTIFSYPFVNWWAFKVVTFWFLWFMLLWTFVCKFFYGYMFSSLLDIYHWIGFLDDMVTLCLTFEELPHYIPKWQCHFTYPSAVIGNSNFSASLLSYIIFLCDYSLVTVTSCFCWLFHLHFLDN